MSWGNRPNETAAMRTMRIRVLREEPICRVDGCQRPATEDDHIVNWAQREVVGMSVSQWHSRSNHQGLCADHHREKTQGEQKAGSARRRERTKLRREPHPNRTPGGDPSA